MDEIVWEAPPESAHANNGGGGKVGRTKRFVAELKKRPGVWAKYPSVMSRNAATVYAKQHPGTEWTGRTLPDGTGRIDLYGRWVGE